MENCKRNDSNYIINFLLLEKFRKIYSNNFEYIDLPYVIEEKYINITLPKNLIPLKHNDNNFYVGSAEQSFIKYMTEGKLYKSNYQSITICNRDEKNLNKYSLLNFIKLELFSTEIPPLQLAHIVLKEYQNYDNRDYSLIKVGEELWDINCNNIEVGSFGTRYNPYTDKSFTFGTGLALPRFTSV